MNLLIVLAIFAAAVLVVAAVIWVGGQILETLRRLQRPVITINIDCKHTWLCVSSSCIVPVSWNVDVTGGEIDFVSVELERVEEYNSAQVLSQVSLSGEISGALDLLTTDSTLFGESGHYRIKVSVVTAGSRDQEPTTRYSSHYLIFNRADEFKYVDSIRAGAAGYEVVEDRLAGHRNIIFSDPASSYSVRELERKVPHYLRTCPKSMALVGISYIGGYHISGGQVTDGLRSLPIVVRRPEENSSLEEIRVDLGGRIDLISEVMVESGVEIYIKFSDDRNVSTSVQNTSAQLEYHFRSIP